MKFTELFNSDIIGYVWNSYHTQGTSRIVLHLLGRWTIDTVRTIRPLPPAEKRRGEIGEANASTLTLSSDQTDSIYHIVH